MLCLTQVVALQGEEVGPLFFSALARVRQIHENCRSLLRTHHQRAGLELMDMMATYQETAYERLCRYAVNIKFLDQKTITNANSNKGLHITYILSLTHVT
jgi:hypothetical protein